MATPTTTLWQVEFCANNMGIYDRAWFATRPEAAAWRRDRIKSGDSNPRTEQGCYGSIDKPEKVKVELTVAGLLQFANNWAVDRGAC